MNAILILKTALNAVLPIILLIVLGYVLKRMGLMPPEFVKIGVKLGYSVFLPCGLFMNVYNIEDMNSVNWDIILYAVAMIGFLFLLGLTVAPMVTRDPRRKGVVLLSVFRSNVAVVGLPIAYALGGEAGSAVASIAIAFTLPVLNIAAVAALSLYTGVSEKGSHFKTALKNIVTNPLVLGICAGLVVLLLREMQIKLMGRMVFSMKEDTEFLYVTLQNIKKLSSPFMLIMLGGQFDFSACKGMLREIVVGTLWRTALSPAIAIALAIALSLHTAFLGNSPAYYATLVALFGSPMAVSSPIMAGQMGNDDQLATQLVVWTSLVSVFTLFLFSCILMYLGFIPL